MPSQWEGRLPLQLLTISHLKTITRYQIYWYFFVTVSLNVAKSSNLDLSWKNDVGIGTDVSVIEL